jgi:Ran GTPase-activating protein (RanGAP) involved in mRNA processing and transport
MTIMNMNMYLQNKFFDIIEIFIENNQTPIKQNFTLKQLLILRETNKKIKEASDNIRPFIEVDYDFGYLEKKEALVIITKIIKMTRYFKFSSLRMDKFAIMLDNDSIGCFYETIKLINLCTANLRYIQHTDTTFEEREYIELFAEVLPQCISLNFLDLSNNHFETEDIEILAESLLQCQVLNHLDLSNCEIKSKDSEILTRALIQCTTLKHLDFEYNSIDSDGLETFARMFSQWSTLTSLDISNSNRNGLVSFEGMLPWNTSLVHIDLSENGIEKLGRVLSQCKSLTNLNLSSNNIGNTENENLAKAFQHCTSLVNLYLGENQIGDSGVISLSEVLSQCKSLKKLSLNDNGIKNFTVVLSQCTASNSDCTELNYLDISKNNFDNNGIKNFFKVLPHYIALTELDFSSNSICDTGMISFSEVLPQCKSLIKLNLSYNGIGYIGIVSFVTVLSQSQCNLKKLNLSYNIINESGAIRIIQCTNTTLNHINLIYNNIDNVIINNMYKKYSSLKNLYLDDYKYSSFDRERDWKK